MMGSESADIENVAQEPVFIPSDPCFELSHYYFVSMKLLGWR